MDGGSIPPISTIAGRRTAVTLILAGGPRLSAPSSSPGRRRGVRCSCGCRGLPFGADAGRARVVPEREAHAWCRRSRSESVCESRTVWGWRSTSGWSAPSRPSPPWSRGCPRPTSGWCCVAGPPSRCDSRRCRTATSSRCSSCSTRTPPRWSGRLRPSRHSWPRCATRRSRTTSPASRGARPPRPVRSAGALHGRALAPRVPRGSARGRPGAQDHHEGPRGAGAAAARRGRRRAGGRAGRGRAGARRRGAARRGARGLRERRGGRARRRSRTLRRARSPCGGAARRGAARREAADEKKKDKKKGQKKSDKKKEGQEEGQEEVGQEEVRQEEVSPSAEERVRLRVRSRTGSPAGPRRRTRGGGARDAGAPAPGRPSSGTPAPGAGHRTG